MKTSIAKTTGLFTEFSVAKSKNYVHSLLIENFDSFLIGCIKSWLFFSAFEDSMFTFNYKGIWKKQKQPRKPAHFRSFSTNFFQSCRLAVWPFKTLEVLPCPLGNPLNCCFPPESARATTRVSCKNPTKSFKLLSKHLANRDNNLTKKNLVYTYMETTRRNVLILLIIFAILSDWVATESGHVETFCEIKNVFKDNNLCQ